VFIQEGVIYVLWKLTRTGLRCKAGHMLWYSWKSGRSILL